MGLSAESTFGSHFQSDASYLPREHGKLFHHGVDRFLELEDLAEDVDRHSPVELAARHGFRDVGDFSNLIGQVHGHILTAKDQKTSTIDHVQNPQRRTLTLFVRCSHMPWTPGTMA